MSCCGNKRAAISKPLSPTPAPSKQTPALANRQTADSVVWFQYTGSSALTVIGRVTNVSYRFAHQGAVLAADARDYMTLASVPSLQRTGGPRT